MTVMKVNDAHLLVIKRLVEVAEANSDIFSSFAHSNHAFKGIVDVDGKPVSVDVNFLASGRPEQVEVKVEAPGNIDYYVAHQGMSRFVLTTHEVTWDAWLRDSGSPSDLFFALRSKVDDLCLEAQYKQCGARLELTRVAIVDPTLYTDYGLLFFDRGVDNSFTINTPKTALVKASYQVDGSPANLDWDASFDAHDYRFLDKGDGTLSIMVDSTTVDIPISITMDQALSLINRTADLLRKLSELAYNFTHPTS